MAPLVPYIPRFWKIFTMLCSFNRTVQTPIYTNLSIIPHQHSPLCLQKPLCGGTGWLPAIGTWLQQAKSLTASPPSTHSPALPTALASASPRAPQQPHHLTFYLPGYFMYKPLTLSPAHTSLLGGKSTCVADISSAALQLLEALRRGEDEGTTQIHITQQAIMSLVLYDASAHLKVHWNPADRQTFLKSFSLHMVYRGTAWNSASWSTTLCTSYWRGCTTCRACTYPKKLFEAERHLQPFEPWA